MDSASAKPHRASAWEWSLVGLLVLNLGWTTLCLGGFRGDTMVVTSVLTALLLAVLFIAKATGHDGDRLHPAGWLLLPFLAYAAGNVLWVTPEPWLGWRDWLGWAQMIAIFWVVLNGIRSPATRTTLLSALLALGVVAVLFACYQRFVRPDWLMLGRTQAAQFLGRASGPFGIPNSLAALLLLVLPATTALMLKRAIRVELRVLFGFLTVVFALGLLLTVSRGAWLALAAVVVLWPFWAVRGSFARRTGYALAALVGVLACGLTLYLAVPGVRDRLAKLRTESGERTRPIMWRGAWQLFVKHPAVGSGAGSFNDLFEQYRPENYQDLPRWAHNDYLNTLSDYGATGFALFFGAGGLIAWSCMRARRSARRHKAEGGKPAGVWPGRAGMADDEDEAIPLAAMAAGMAAFALQLLVDFHFKIPALAMAFAIVGALAVQQAWPLANRERAGARWERVATGLAALAITVVTLLWVVPMNRAEGLRYLARQSINLAAREHTSDEALGPILLQARADLERAVALDPANAEAWADLAYAVALRAHNEPARAGDLGREAERAADRALAISRVPPEFWVRRGVALDLQGRWYDAGGAFIQALRLAPARASIWYQHAFHLGLDLTDPGRAEAAIAFCLRLDPGNYEAQELQHRLAERRRVP